MAHSGDAVAGAATFGRIKLVDDPERCQKLLSGGGSLPRGPEGVLRMVGGGLQWQGPDRTVDIPRVASADVFRDGFIRVDYEGPDGAAVVLLQDRSAGLRRLVETTQNLAAAIRSGLGLPESQAARENLARTALVAADASIAAARSRLWLGGGAALGGLIATLISRSGGESSGPTRVYWGGIVLGSLWFVAGVAGYYEGRRAREKVGGAAAEPAGGVASGRQRARTGLMALVAVGVVMAGVVVALVTRGSSDDPPSASTQTDVTEVPARPLASRESVEDQVRTLIRTNEFGLFGDSTVESVSCPETLPGDVGERFTCEVVFGEDAVLHFDVAFGNRGGTLGWCAARSRAGDAFNERGNPCNDAAHAGY